MTLTFKKTISTLLLPMVFLGTLYSQYNVNKSSLKKISGYVLNNNSPLENVNIIIINSKKGTKTNRKGFYSIKAKKGDVIKFSYLGMKPVEVIVEDNTKILNINMRIFYNKLDEVVLEKVVRMPTAYGEINPNKGSITYIKGDELNLGIDLYTAIKYRASPVRSSGSINLKGDFVWDIDGVVYLPKSPTSPGPPEIDISNVQDVAILRSYADLVFYGNLGFNGVVVVRTKNAYFAQKNLLPKHNPYINKNIYKDDALILGKSNLKVPQNLDFLISSSNSKQAYDSFVAQAKSFNNNPGFYIDAAKYILAKYNDARYAINILSLLEKLNSDNPEILKAIAYTYQEQGLQKEAISTYKKIIKLHPNYAQSFRDLANAYAENEQYKDSWKIYMNYLYRGNKLNEKGIGLIIYNEMESLFTQKKDISNIRETFISREAKDIKKDVRIVFEWSVSEAEFSLQFVNPQNQSYTFEHSFYANKDIIIDEKLNGYSSMEFFIDKLKKGDWLVNITYLGNKKYTPTYLKTTVYYNWGLANQSKDIKVFDLDKKNIKIQLLKLTAKLPAYLGVK